MINGFNIYPPGTDERKTLKIFMEGKKNISALSTSLLIAELTVKREEDAEFLCGLGASRKYLDSYGKFKKWQKENWQRERQRLTRRFVMRSGSIESAYKKPRQELETVQQDVKELRRHPHPENEATKKMGNWTLEAPIRLVRDPRRLELLQALGTGD